MTTAELIVNNLEDNQVVTIENRNILVACSNVQTAEQILNTIIGTNGELKEQYHYVYDLFNALNKIYHSDFELDREIDSKLYDQVINKFDGALSDMDWAIGLTAGIVSGPFASIPLKNCNEKLDDVGKLIEKLNQLNGQIFKSEETSGYINSLMSANENEQRVNVEVLMQYIIWTAISECQRSDVSSEDFNDLLLAIKLKFIELSKNNYKLLWEMKGLTIDFNRPVDKDPGLSQVKKVMDIIGGTLLIPTLVLNGLGWYMTRGGAGIIEASGVQPSFRLRTSIAQMPNRAQYAEVWGRASRQQLGRMLKLAGTIFSIVTAIVAIIGTVIAVIQLKSQRDQISDSKQNFKDSYDKLTDALLTLVDSANSYQEEETALFTLVDNYSVDIESEHVSSC